MNVALQFPTTAAKPQPEIKEAVRTGALPKGVYSVKTRHGRAIDVRISQIPFMVPHRQRVSFDVQHPNMHVNGAVIPLQSAMAYALMDKVESMLNAYKRDNSDTMTDYFDVNFYGNVGFEWEWVQEQRKAMEAQERERPSYTFTLWEAPNHGLRSWTDLRPKAGA